MSARSSLEDKLKALPDAKHKHKVWTMKEDAAILRFADSKGISAVARVLEVDRASVSRRYRFLKAKVGKNG